MTTLTKADQSSDWCTALSFFVNCKGRQKREKESTERERNKGPSEGNRAQAVESE